MKDVAKTLEQQIWKFCHNSKKNKLSFITAGNQLMVTYLLD